MPGVACFAHMMHEAAPLELLGFKTLTKRLYRSEHLCHVRPRECTVRATIPSHDKVQADPAADFHAPKPLQAP